MTAGLLSFVAACAVHYVGYRRFLDVGLKDDDPALRRSALVGWARFAIAWQVIVMVVAGLWILSFALRHAHGYTWSLPAIGLVVGTALPLQLVVMRISRANR